jgi:hypothetical protein
MPSGGLVTNHNRNQCITSTLGWRKFTVNRDLVWKLILLIGSRDPKYGKWSPNWEGAYRINQCVPGNAYILETLEGKKFARALNGKYLKKYYPSIWVDSWSSLSLISWFEIQVTVDHGKIIFSGGKPNHRSMFGFMLWPIYKSSLEYIYIYTHIHIHIYIYISSSSTMMVSHMKSTSEDILDNPLQTYYISYQRSRRWGRRKRKTKKKVQIWRRWITRWGNSSC